MLHNLGMKTECWLACHVATANSESESCFFFFHLFFSLSLISLLFLALLLYLVPSAVSFVCSFMPLHYFWNNFVFVLSHVWLAVVFNFGGILVNACHFIKYTEQLTSIYSIKSIFNMFLRVLTKICSLSLSPHFVRAHYVFKNCC